MITRGLELLVAIDAQKMAAGTWRGDWWKFGGGGVVWNAITYDAELRRIYIGTGNGTPFNRTIRSQGQGDNLFLASIVAHDAETGRYLWHYQTNPGDERDYDATLDITLATLDIDGRSRKVLMQVSKNGFFYVIDRGSGQLISAQPFARVTWASKIDIASGRPVEAPGARYHGGKPFELWPGPSGAHSWLPMSFSPKTKLVYIPADDRPAIIGDEGIDIQSWKLRPNNLYTFSNSGDFDPDLPGANKSFLLAWDPVLQRVRWKHDTPGFWGGGTVAAAGNLVFQGQIDHLFNAYAADTGRLLWSFDARSPVVAPPITYSVHGEQFITVQTGFGSSGGTLGKRLAEFAIDYRTMPRRVLTFALNRRGTLPEAPPPTPMTAPDDPDFVPDASSAKRGAQILGLACVSCHGINAIAAGAAPDLRISSVPSSAAAFDAIVRNGTDVARGMPQFADLSAEDVEAVRLYLRTLGQELPNRAH